MSIFNYLKPAASGCTDIDECEYFNDPWFSGSLNLTYSYPTFRNLPEDQRTWSFYEPQPCPSGDACVNVFYQNGQGFKCVPEDETFAAVVLGGLDWNRESEVLKADLTRCDGAIPSFHKEIYFHRVRQQSRFLLFFPGRNAPQMASGLWRLLLWNRSLYTKS